MKSIAHFVVIGGMFLSLLSPGCGRESSPADVVADFHEAVDAADKKTVLSLIADYPEKERRFASSSIGAYLEKPKASTNTDPPDILDFHVIGDTAVVLFRESLSDRYLDIDPIYLLRTSEGWKIAPGIYYPLLYGDAQAWGGEAKMLELQESMFALEEWRAEREKELKAYYRRIDYMKNGFE